MSPSSEIDLSRRILSRVDTKLRSELDEEKGEWLVKVPASPAVRAVWKRYCGSVGIPMGHGLAVLLHHELASIVDEDIETLSDRLEAREAELESRSRELDDRATELDRRERALSLRETNVREREKKVAATESNVAVSGYDVAQQPNRITKTDLAAPRRKKLGRNELCWCRSGKKYKHCHLPADD